MRALVLLSLVLFACGGEPFDTPDAGDAPDAAGLLSDAGDDTPDAGHAEEPDAGEECVPPTAEEVCGIVDAECGVARRRNPCTQEIEDYRCPECPTGFACTLNHCGPE